MRERCVRLERRGDAEPLCGRDHRRQADFLSEADGHRIDRARERGLQSDRTCVAAVEIVGRPILDRDRLVVADGVAGEAFFQRGQIDERLERRARRTMRVGDAVERAFGIIAAAHDRAHGAIGPHRDKCGLLGLSARAALLHHAIDGRAGRLLHRDIERGDDREIACRVWRERLCFVGRGIEEIIALGVRSFGDDGCGMRKRVRDLTVLHPAMRDERTQYARRALLRGLQIAPWRVGGRCIGQRGEHRGFRERHLARGFAEIDLRGAIHAVRAGAEIDAVQIELEDLVLGEQLLELTRARHLDDLARDRAVGREEKDLHQLLCDGRPALIEASRLEIDECCAGETAEIDAVMVIKTAVLHDEKRLGEMRRHIGEAQPVADDRTAPADEFAFFVQERVGRRAVERIKIRVQRKNRSSPGEPEIDERHRADRHRAADHERRQGKARRETAQDLSDLGEPPHHGLMAIQSGLFVATICIPLVPSPIKRERAPTVYDN